MYCPNCGNNISDNSNNCTYCGASTGINQGASVNPDHQTSKTLIGFLLGLILGLIGLVIGILMYPSNTVARSTFIKGWLISFVLGIVASIFITILYVGFILAMTGGAL